jgi:hypothetical protein
MTIAEGMKETDQMRLSDVTALGRPIDPNYPTNRAIAALTIVIIGGGTAVQLLMGTAWLQSIQWGVGAGLSVFLAWALARELDPDHDLSAFWGAGLMLIGLFFFDLPSLLMLLWLLIVLRILNRTSGLSARVLDSLALLVLGGWLTWQGQWVAGLMTTVAFGLDGWLVAPLKRHRFFSGLALVATVTLAVFNGNIAMESGPSLPTVAAAVVISGLFVLVILAAREIESVGDKTGERLNPRRVQAGQIVALVAALLAAGWEGKLGVVALLPLWAATFGAALYQLGLLAGTWRAPGVSQ